MHSEHQGTTGTQARRGELGLLCVGTPSPLQKLLSPYQVPGNAPLSARPSSILSRTKLVGPRTKAMQDAAAPQVTQMNASHAGPPNLQTKQTMQVVPQPTAGHAGLAGQLPCPGFRGRRWGDACIGAWLGCWCFGWQRLNRSECFATCL